MPHQPSSLFSVIVANYNNGDYIDEMVESVMNQSYSSWELIIVDDGSTDKSKSILEKYKKDPRVSVIFNSKNQGPATCLNIGLKHAKGTIIGRLDSDDKLDSSALHEMTLAHETHPKASLICSHCLAWHSESNRTELWNRYTDPKSKSLIEKCTVGHFATWKKAASNQISPVNEQLKKAVDLDLYLRLEEVGQIIFWDKPLYWYRQHEGGISQGDNGVEAYQFATLARAAAFKRRKNTQTPNLTQGQYNDMMRTWYIRECHPLRWVQRRKCNLLMLKGAFEIPSLLITKDFWSILLRNNLLKP